MTGAACPACGAPTVAGDRFCRGCGRTLSRTPSPPPGAGNPSSGGKTIPKLPGPGQGASAFPPLPQPARPTPAPPPPPAYLTTPPTPPPNPVTATPAPATGGGGLTRHPTSCGWCGGAITRTESGSVGVCGRCGKKSINGQCPRCRSIATSRLKGRNVYCSVCGHKSTLNDTDTLDKVASAGANAFAAGCSLAVVFWVLLPLLILLIGLVVVLVSG